MFASPENPSLLRTVGDPTATSSLCGSREKGGRRRKDGERDPSREVGTHRKGEEGRSSEEACASGSRARRPYALRLRVRVRVPQRRRAPPPSPQPPSSREQGPGMVHGHLQPSDLHLPPQLVEKVGRALQQEGHHEVADDEVEDVEGSPGCRRRRRKKEVPSSKFRCRPKSDPRVLAGTTAIRCVALGLGV